MMKKQNKRKIVVYGLAINSLKSQPAYTRAIEIYPMKQRGLLARILLKDISNFFN